MDIEAYEHRARTGPRVMRELLAGNPDYPGRVVFVDEHAVAFLAR